LSPVKILIEEPLEVSCGTLHTLVLNKTGKVFAFGANSCGQLGTGNKRASLVPVGIETEFNFRKVACGSFSAGISDEDKLLV
jgi:Alpha-tubulin suppressor and related RCC1 domain-containing proteins